MQRLLCLHGLFHVKLLFSRQIHLHINMYIYKWSCECITIVKSSAFFNICTPNVNQLTLNQNILLLIFLISLKTVCLLLPTFSFRYYYIILGRNIPQTLSVRSSIRLPAALGRLGGLTQWSGESPKLPSDKTYNSRLQITDKTQLIYVRRIRF